MQRNLVAILLLLLIGGGATFLLLNRMGNEPVPTSSQPTPNPPEPPVESRPIQTIEVGKSGEAPPIREEVKSVPLAANTDAPQGVKGRVVDERGAPVKGASVWLMPAPAQDLFSQMLAKQRGVIFRAISTTTTDDLGAFAIGILKPDEHPSTQLRVVAQAMTEGRVPNLRITNGEWHDAGQIKLEHGVVLTGTVRSAETKAPLAGAEVTIKQQTMGFDLAPTPGRENGIVAKTDASGTYRFEDAPFGPVTVAAVGVGCARLERAGVNLVRETPNTQDFELSVGRSIAGTVVAADSTPIEGAVVTAIAISSKTPMQVETRSGRNGRFEVLGLVEGLYQMTAVAEGFSRGQPKPVDAGEAEAVLTLEKLGSVQVQVYGKTGRLLSDYTLTIKTHSPGQELFGNTQIPPKHVRAPRDGMGTVEGLDPGAYVVQVEAAGHARAFSEPFTLVPGQVPPVLTVRMNEGGVITGVVYGRDGAPLQGANVATLQGDLDESPVNALFGSLIPCNITKTAAVTDDKGVYRLTLLNEGKYHVKIAHTDHFDVRFPDVEVHSGQTVTLPEVRMASGTVVLGTVRVDGVPSGQIKVAVTSVTNPTKPGAPFHCEAQTGSDGRFVLARRLPPGRYTIQASRQTADNPFLQITDYTRTRQEFEVGGGQTQYPVDLLITSK